MLDHTAVRLVFVGFVIIDSDKHKRTAVAVKRLPFFLLCLRFSHTMNLLPISSFWATSTARATLPCSNGLETFA